MNTQRIHKLLVQIGSQAQGLSGAAWVAQLRRDDVSYLTERVSGMAVQLENLQAVLDELKQEVTHENL